MTGDLQRMVVIPCSGMGKTYGSVAREAGYELCDELRPERTRLVALAKLVLGDEEARNLVRTRPVVTIDGCKLMCASKLVAHGGGTVTHEIEVLDVYKRHRDLKPDGIAELNDQGLQLARVLAEEVAGLIDASPVHEPSGGGRG